MMIVTDDLRSLILENASARDLRRVAARQGTTSLREDGFRHVREGRTTVEEVLRVTKDDAFEQSALGDAMREG
jgi:type II secretory ATPase GspE/PulE/Tfp pilus assembly ATPase PilB-like protein